MNTKANLYILALAVLTTSAAAENVDPAPSGRELSEIHTSEGSRATLEMPGRDTPARVEREGPTTTIDFDPEGHVGTASERDTTIVYDDE